MKDATDMDAKRSNPSLGERRTNDDLSVVVDAVPLLVESNLYDVEI